MAKERNIAREAMLAASKQGAHLANGRVISAETTSTGYWLSIISGRGPIEEAVFHYDIDMVDNVVRESHCGTAPGCIATEFETISRPRR